MSQDNPPDAVTTRALNRSAVTYDRRDAIVSLLAFPIALAAGMSSAAEAVEYPVWNIETGGGRVYLLGHTPPRPIDWSDSRIERLLRTCRSLWNEAKTKILRLSSSRRDRCSATLLAFASLRCCSVLSCFSFCSVPEFVPARSP
jgi:hypothetical protein